MKTLNELIKECNSIEEAEKKFNEQNVPRGTKQLRMNFDTIIEEEEAEIKLLAAALYECYLISKGVPLEEVYKLKLLPEKFYKN